MLEHFKPLYAPALRMKSGELQGIDALSPDIAERILPRFIVPPPIDRDKELAQLMMFEDRTPAVAGVLSKYWKRRPVLVDVTYLIDEFGRSSGAKWLPKIFEACYQASVWATPMVSLRDLPDLLQALKSTATPNTGLQLALRVASGDMVGSAWKSAVSRGLDALGASPKNCCVVADFGDADFSQPELVAGVIQGSLEELQEIGLWKHLIFQGSNFPEKNPATPNSNHVVLRNEWSAWCQAVRFDPATAEHMLFGDYAADCTKMAFGAGGGRAIRHYRYTTRNGWLIQRGARVGKDSQIMSGVCAKIVESEHFAGRDFSAADDYIYPVREIPRHGER